ncbi:MAG: dihydrofolate reductase family protein [Caulobacteraceae bacterium]
MRRIIASAFVSLDGVMQSPGGPEEDPTAGFRFGGWTAPYFDAALGGAMGDVFASPFELLLGRKTYDIFAAHWPNVTDPKDPIAALFNDVAKYVASRSKPTLGGRNSHLLEPDAVTALEALKAGEGADLLVQGSGDFLQTLWKHRLVDEFTLLTFPVLLGRGKRLFGEGVVPGALKLLEAKPFTSGVILARYRPEGEVRTGTFQRAEPSEAELERRRDLA